MPHEELTPRSDSEASGASPPEHSEMGGSPPDNSETSSGVHSNSSRESTSAQRRSTSVDDLATDAANKVGLYLHLRVWMSYLIMITPKPKATVYLEVHNFVDSRYPKQELCNTGLKHQHLCCRFLPSTLFTLFS